MKVLERILEGRIRKCVEIKMNEEQQGFRKGRGMMDGTVGGEEVGGTRCNGIGICGPVECL